TNRFVDIDFNSLITVINISSWVMVLDFFSTDQDECLTGRPFGDVTPDTSQSLRTMSTEEINTILEVQVRSLTLILNKPESELARANVSQVLVRSVGSEGNLTLTGRLGSLSLVDCTSHGDLYREKFVTSGTEAMTFQVFKYGHEDPDMQRECDIRMKLKMSSVMYIHTQRFAMELTQFIQQFNQLRDIVSRWRATSAGLEYRAQHMLHITDRVEPILFTLLSCGHHSALESYQKRLDDSFSDITPAQDGEHHLMRSNTKWKAELLTTKYPNNATFIPYELCGKAQDRM
ncbi:hypothetical protein SK128_002187, partial [Halocaridina rubra]